LTGRKVSVICPLLCLAVVVGVVVLNRADNGQFDAATKLNCMIIIALSHLHIIPSIYRKAAPWLSVISNYL